MDGKKYILAFDQGTTGSGAIIFNADGKVVSSSDKETRQIYPQPGWVEHDPHEIWQTSLQVAREAISSAGIDASDIACIGITNQRETTIIWERKTGRPVHNAVVWQCRRTASICENLKSKGLEQAFQQKTGLILDAYFSGTKLRWILDNIPDGQKRAENGELLFGTVDTWLAWNLSGGQAHVTDYSNASRTLLFNIHRLEWDADILAELNIPEVMLPRVISSSQIYGETAAGLFGSARLPLGAIAGDQQAALFGQACYRAGMAKNTYGTGSFILLNSGEKPIASRQGLLTSLAWGLDGKVNYALEGSVFITGAAVQWLRDGLSIITSAEESEALARTVPDNGGVYFVPAFVGLGAPYWDMYARGAIIGITRGSTRGHIARATIEAIAYQVKDVVEAMKSEAGISIPVLRVDGGGTANRLLMQFQSDILGTPIQVAAIAETTALGAAYLAGLAAGLWKTTDEIAGKWQAAETFEPAMSPDERETLYGRWKNAVQRTRGWIEN